MRSEEGRYGAETVGLYGLMAEFAEPEVLLETPRRAYVAGYRHMDAYSPFPVEGLAEAIGFRRTRLPLVVLCGGIIGGVGGFLLQYYASVIDYPPKLTATWSRRYPCQ